MRRLLRSLLAAFVIPLALGSCTGDTPSGGNVLVVSTVEITPAGASLILGGAEQLTATAKTSGGVAVTGRTATWSSSNTGIASVSSTGLVTARAVGGPVTITATIDRVSATVPVTVLQKPVGSVTVAPAQAQITIGGAQQFTATTRADDGEVLTGRTVSWESLDPTIASINSSTGAAVGLAQGTATLRATSEGKLGTASLVVGARPASRLGFTTQPPAATAGQPFGPVRVAVQDDIGGTIPGATTAITLSLADNPGSATLGGTLTANAVQGIATFTDLLLTQAAPGYTLRASALALSPALSNPFTVAPAAAAALAMATQPSAGAQSGVALAQQPAVQLRDALGNAVPQAGVVVTAALVGGTGTLGGGLTATTNASGVATFTSLAIGAPTGNYTLRFTAAGLTAVNSSAISIGAGAGTTLGVTTQPSSAAQSGVPFTQQPVLQVQDANGNPVAQGGITVTVAIGSGGGALGGTSSVITNASGVAAFTGLSIAGAAGSYTLTFSAAGLTSATSNAITLGAGGAAALAMMTQPSSPATNGVALGTQPAVRLMDASGNSVSQAGVVVTASVTGGAGVTTGATATTDASGVATFTGLTLAGTVGSYPLTFAAPGLTSVSSSPVTLQPGTATQLVVTRQPSSGAQSGTAFTVQPQVQVADASGNAVAVSGVTVTAALASGAGTLGGTLTATTNASGLATFTTLAITGPSGTYTIRFTATGYTDAVSGVVGLGAGVATQLSITTQPSASAQSGVVLVSQPVIQLRDAAGNVVAQAGTVVTAELASGGGTLGGTLTATTGGTGVATFTNLAISGTVGDRTLRFTATGLASVTSGTIAVAAGPAATIAATSATTQTATAGSAVAAPPSVVVRDASGNPVSGVSVTFAVTAGGGSIAPTPATLTTNASGIAALTSWTTGTTAGTNTVTATTTGLAGSPVTFTATGTAGTATTIAATTSTNQSASVGTAVTAAPTVRVTDVNGNPVSGVSVVFAVASGGGSTAPASPATVTTNASGIAGLTSWTLGATAGTNTVTATATGLAGSPITFTATGFAGSATTIAANSSVSQTAAVGTAVAAAPSVRVTDASSNGVAGVPVAFAVTVGGGSIVPAGPVIVTTDASGVASLTSWTLGAAAGTNTVQASAGSLSGSPVSFNATGTAGSASRLSLTTTPSSTAQSGVALVRQPVVQVEDGSGNPVPQAGLVVTAEIASGGGSLGGTTTATTNASGVATFTDLSISGTAGSRTLRFTATGLTSATSGTITLAAGVAAVIAANSTTSQSKTVGTAVTSPPSVLVTDASGNAVSGVSVTFAVTGGGGSVNNAASAVVATNLSGLATLTNWTLGTAAGANTVTASAAGLSGSPVGFSATGTAGAASQLTLTTAPSASVRNAVALAAQPVAQLRDQYGNAVAQSGTLVTVTTGVGVTLTGNTATTVANGSATFSGLTLTGTVGAYTLSFGSPGLTAVTSSVTVTAGGATKLALTTSPPATAQSEVAFDPQPVVQVQDMSGNPLDTSLTVTASITSQPGIASSLNNSTASTGGGNAATFSGLSIQGITGQYTLRFAAGSLTPVTGVLVRLTAGAPTSVTVTGVPATSRSGLAFAPGSVVATVRDAANNPVPGVGVTATLTGSGSLIGTTSDYTNASGQVTFTGLGITSTTLGSRSLTFDVGILASTTQSTTLKGGVATRLDVTTEPGTPLTNGGTLAPQPVVQLRDASGNATDTAATTVTATVVEAGATLSGTTAVATSAATGAATYTNLVLTGTAGSYRLRFAAGVLTPDTSTAIVLTAGSAAKLGVTTQPSSSAQSGEAFTTQPVVQVQDVSGNAVSGARDVTAAIATGTGTLGGTATVTTSAAGTATFSGLSITGTAGAYTLSFTATGLTSATSSTITLGAGGATALQMVTQPSGTATNGVALGTVPQVRLVDGSGNPVSQSGVAITVTAGGATVSAGASANTNASGVATFSGLTLTGPSGSYTLSFASTGLAGVSSSSVTLGVGAASKLVIATAPSSTAESGVAFATQPVIQVQDVGGNVVTGSSAAVTVAKASGSGTLGGTTTVNAVSGVATFTTLKLSGSGNHTLSFTATGLTSATSGTIAVSQVARSLDVATQPADAVSGVNFTTQPVGRILDAAGLVVTTGSGATLTIRASVSSGSGTLAGTTDITASGGIATFTNLKITGTGTHVLQFAALTTSLTVLSGSFVVEAPPVAGIRLNVGSSSIVSGTVGADLAIPLLVDMTDRGTENLASLTVRVSWDPTKFQYVSNSAGSWVDSVGSAALTFPNVDSVTTGVFLISGISTSRTVASFTLRNLVLRPLVTGALPVTATVPAAGNEDGGEITVTPRNLTVNAAGAGLREALGPVPIPEPRRVRGRT